MSSAAVVTGALRVKTIMVITLGVPLFNIYSVHNIYCNCTNFHGVFKFANFAVGYFPPA